MDKELLTLIISTGIISAAATTILSGLRDWWTSRAKRRQAAAYLAARIAVILDAFLLDCRQLLASNAAALDDAGGHPAGSAKLPALASYPDDADAWRALDPIYVAWALGLRNKIDEYQADIKECLAIDDQDGMELVEDTLRALQNEIASLKRSLQFRYGLEFYPIDFLTSIRHKRTRAASQSS